jgi:hypothetical protein
MRRAPILVSAALVAAATASAIAVTTGSAQAPGERTLTFVEREVSGVDVFQDVPPLVKGKDVRPTNGDGILFKNTVLDATGKTKLGIFEAHCTFLHATRKVEGSRVLCDGFYTLADGTITAQVATNLSDQVTFAVTGGTGAYEGASGSGSNISRGRTSKLSDTVIHLLP